MNFPTPTAKPIIPFPDTLLGDDSSDIDYRGVYLPPADLHWSLYGIPEQLECHETQEVY